jgi:hypothetical protein
MSQLTTKETCKQKRNYHTRMTAVRAVKRRNKAAGYNYLRQYKCNNCIFWHVTTQVKDTPVSEDK